MPKRQPCCRKASSFRGSFRFLTRRQGGEKDTQGARSRHSDKEKFCNDLNGPKTRKMSEWPLKTLQDFPTSKLNTRVRFPSPAPNFSMTWRDGRISF